MSMTENNIKRVAILGGSGFTGAELFRLLCNHPHFKVDFVSSESLAGLPVNKYFMALRHNKDANSLKFKKISELENHYDIIFSCLPNGVLPKNIKKLSSCADYIFNVSGDYRISDQDILQKHYPDTLQYEFEGRSQYFIPEFDEVDLGNKVVNLPGCMAVATIYSLYPLLANNLIEDRVVTDVKTGSSGGGKSSTEHPSERAHNFRPHKLHGHRHKPEIVGAFKNNLEKTIDLQFSVHSLDLPRGIMATSYSFLKSHVSEIEVKKAFYTTYKSKRFVHYFNKNSHYSLPMIKTVVGTNIAEVGVYIEDHHCVTIASIDNLIKGAAGQAIQAANLYMGFPEEEGLQLQGMWP